MARAALASVLLATLAAAAGHAEDAPHPGRESLLATARAVVGTEWYGVYVRGSKVGYAQTTARLTDAAFRLETDIRTTLRSRGEDVELEIFNAVSAALAPPHALLVRESSVVSAGRRERTLVERVGDAYRATITQAGEERRATVAPTSFGLADVLAISRLVRSRPDVGATLRYAEWDDERLATKSMVATVAELRHHAVGGTRVRVYDVEFTDPDGSTTSATYDATGRLIRSDVSGYISLRLEPEAEARRRGAPQDVFTSHMVPVNQRLGEAKAVKTLVLSVGARYGRVLGPAPGQTVTSTGEGRYRIALDPEGGPRVRARPEEIEDALRATVDFPADHPTVLELAREAVGDAQAPRERVRRLVAFVSDYVRDGTQVARIPVLAVIRQRRGDCTEHADLLTALARAAGVPCRSVAGLMYVGGDVPAFAGHAWNEVVLDGFWTPVDPSWNQMRPDATHIRYPVVQSEQMTARALLPTTVLRVESVNGRPIGRDR